MPGSNRRSLLRKRASIQVDYFNEDEEDQKFKVPKFQPLSSRYKKLEDKRAKEEEKEKQKMLKKQKDLKEAEEAEANVQAIGRTNKKLELEKVEIQYQEDLYKLYTFYLLFITNYTIRGMDFCF